MVSHRAWRDSCPRLNEFVFKLHQEFAANLEWVQGRLREALDQAFAAKRRQDVHTENRRRWRDRIIAEPDLQNEHNVTEGHVREGFTLKDRPGQVWGLCPKHLVGCDIPVIQQFHLPPPVNKKNENEIGRKFSVPEIVCALALVHESHGQFPELLPAEFRQINPLWFRPMQISRDADEAWVPLLEAWLQQIKSLMPEPPSSFVPNTFQAKILAALDGKALKKQALADALCGGEGTRLYRKDGIKELMALGKVSNKSRLGYYRPDAPPSLD